MVSLEKNQGFIGVQKSIKTIPVEAKLEANSLQISNEKINGKYVVTGLTYDGVQISNVKFQGKSFVILGETKWRQKKQGQEKN